MENILNKEYFHFGTNNIRKELWLNLYMQKEFTNYSKPLGGLWCSKQNDYNFCEWLIYKEDTIPHDYEIYVGDQKSCLVKFKNDSKILSISNTNDYKNLKDSGMVVKLDEPIQIYGLYDYMIVEELPNYEKIKEFYDLLYVNPHSDKSLYQYSVDTILAIKSTSVEYYKPLECDYYGRKITSIGNKEQIKDVNKEYLELLKYLKELLTNTNSYNFKEILDSLINNENILKLLPDNIDKKHALGVAIINTYNKIQDEKKLVLHN